MAKIDAQDRRYILLLNDVAASFRKLAEVTPVPEARGVYLGAMAFWSMDLDRVVKAAMRRAA